AGAGALRGAGGGAEAACQVHARPAQVSALGRLRGGAAQNRDGQDTKIHPPPSTGWAGAIKGRRPHLSSKSVSVAAVQLKKSSRFRRSTREADDEKQAKDTA